MTHRKVRVNLDRNAVSVGEKVFCFETCYDRGTRAWFRLSRKWVQDDEGAKYRLSDLEEQGIFPGQNEEGLTPAEIPVRKAGWLKLLNHIVDQAEKRKRLLDEKKRKAERLISRSLDKWGNLLPEYRDENEEDGDDVEEDEAETQEADEVTEGEDDEGSDEDRQEKSPSGKKGRKGPKSRSTVSIRFTDSESGRAFDFYLARSKKDSSQYFVAIYQGKKPLRYANVKPQAILDFKQKVAGFSVKG